MSDYSRNKFPCLESMSDKEFEDIYPDFLASIVDYNEKKYLDSQEEDTLGFCSLCSDNDINELASILLEI